MTTSEEQKKKILEEFKKICTVENGGHVLVEGWEDELLLYFSLYHDAIMEEVKEKIEALQIILMPMAKGYAAEHEVGMNKGMVESSQEIFNALLQPSENTEEKK